MRVWSGQPRVVDRARRRGEVVDEIDLAVDLDRLRQVLVQEGEPVVADVLDVLQRTGVQVVDADHAVALGQQPIAEMGAQEPRSPGDHAGAHLNPSIVPQALGGHVALAQRRHAEVYERVAHGCRAEAAAGQGRLGRPRIDLVSKLDVHEGSRATNVARAAVLPCGMPEVGSCAVTPLVPAPKTVEQRPNVAGDRGSEAPEGAHYRQLPRSRPSQEARAGRLVLNSEPLTPGEELGSPPPVPPTVR